MKREAMMFNMYLDGHNLNEISEYAMESEATVCRIVNAFIEAEEKRIENEAQEFIDAEGEMS